MTPVGDAQPVVGVLADPDVDVLARGAQAIVHLAVRTLATRGITLLGTIALARILTPAEFGAFAVLTLVVTLISVMGDLGIGPALIQQKHTPSENELSTALIAQLALWTIIAAIVWWVAGTLPTLRPDLPPDSPGIARLLAVSLLLVGFRALPTAMLSRVLRFGPLAAIEVLQQVIYFGVATALALADYGVWSFAVAAVVQNVFATITIYAVWRRWVGFRFDIRIARRLLAFGIGYQLAHILSWGRDAVVPTFGTLAGGLKAVGILGFAWQNGQLVRAVEQIVSQVTFPALSRLQSDKERIATATAISLEMSMAAVCLIQFWIIAAAPILVPAVFSNTWIPAVMPLQLVCIGSLAGAPTYVLRSYLYARGESRQALLLTAASLTVLIIAFPILATSFGLVGAAWSFVLCAAAGLALFIQATRGEVRFPWRASARIVVETTIAAVLAGVVIHVIGGLVGVILSGSLYLAVATIEFWVAEPLLVRRARTILWGGRSVVRPSGSPALGA